jgi:hypothetical protein
LQILFSGAIPGEDPFGIRAVIGVLDTSDGKITHLTEYEPPEWLRGGQNIQFTGFRRVGEVLYACLFNEILVYEGWPLPSEPARRITHRQFNDLHDCHPWQGGLLVANTGLETIDHVDLEGALIRRWDLVEGEPDGRSIDPELDYRLVPSTKPHLCHVNHVFDLDGEVWATRLVPRDAICLTRPGPHMPIGIGNPHDGLRHGDDVIFTTTNGHLLFVDARDISRTRTHDLSAMSPGLDQLGWCRGVCPVPGDHGRCFVAFTKARRSKWREMGFWIRYGHDNPQSRVALYDLERGSLLETWLMGPDPGLILFQLEVLPEDQWV